MKTKHGFVAGWLGLAASLLALPVAHSAAGAKEAPLIAILQSNAPAAEKAIPCKQLAIYGSAAAVPALAPLLQDAELASWARIALEAIPGPTADEALREALEKVDGRLLIGVINSIGVRRDPRAVTGLIPRLKHADAGVVAAAAAALGRIGGEPATRALLQSLAGAPAAVKAEIALGCIFCAEHYLGEGKPTEAAEIYDTVRLADVPTRRILEATRGAILARGDAGLPLLLEQLRSTEKDLFGIGLRTARELPGEAVTRALEAEMNRSTPHRAALVLLAIADRPDAAVRPTVLRAAGSGPNEVRLVAVQALENLGDAAAVDVLLGAATDEDTKLAKAAAETLTRIGDSRVDTVILDRLPPATGARRGALIQVAALRQIAGALPEIVRSVVDSDPAVRAAALGAIGVLGGKAEVGVLVGLIEKTSDTKQRADLADALLEVAGRTGATCTADILPLMREDDAELRLTAIAALASVGGAEALGAVTGAIRDREQSVQDEAVRTLSTWPNNWPEDVAIADTLLGLAKSGAKRSHQVLGFRGYVQHVQAAPGLSPDDRVARIKALLPIIQWPEEKQAAISALGAVPASSAVALLLDFTADPADAETAWSALVSLAGRNIDGMTREQRRDVLQKVLDNSKNEATTKRANDTLRRLR
ncbi:MAG: HEAT repeat domain-containing protein [Verrucomicrobiales bacterium]|nr:HEAT repeat domain-containing protein [Verrucomicrobiales bacterium]